MKQLPPTSPRRSIRPAGSPGPRQTHTSAALTLFAVSLLALAAASCSSEPAGAQQGLSETTPSSVSAAAPSTSNGPSSPAPVQTTQPESPQDSPKETSLPAQMTTPNPEPESAESPAPTDATPKMEVATLGAGCFWCIEAVLEQLDGVESVVSGYMGGEIDNPTYKQVCTGNTGHAEVVQVTFDPKILPYKDLLDWFWKSHDPTTLNRQGADVGTQYRSAIFTHSPSQLETAQTSKKDVQPTFSNPIVTQVTSASTFYPATEDHQGYYFDNASQGYCRMVIAPKLKKLGLKY